MTGRCTSILAFVGALPLLAFAAQPAAIAVVNVSVVPMDRDRVVAGQTVVVVDGKIAAVGPADTVKVPAGAQRIDGAGRFLMPGLADMHVHFAVTGNTAQDTAENERLAEIFVAHGITTVRVMNGSPGILALRRRIDAGEVPGPRIFSTGPINGLSRTVSYRPETVAEANALVAEQKAAGYDAIKLTNLTPEVYTAFLSAAKREGIPVYGHVPAPVTFEMAARGGLRSAEHVIPFAVSLAPADRPRATGPSSLAPELSEWSRLPALAALLRDNGVWVCPTVVVAQRFTAEEKRRRLADESMRNAPQRMRDAWAADVDNDRTDPAPGLLGFGLTLVKRLHDAGVGLLLGSDDMNPYIVPGAALHEELALLVKAGLSPYQALRAGTSDAARFLGRETEFGTIAPGQRGDLLLLDANPLENVANASRPVSVIVRGRPLARR